MCVYWHNVLFFQHTFFTYIRYNLYNDSRQGPVPDGPQQDVEITAGQSWQRKQNYEYNSEIIHNFTHLKYLKY